MNIYVCVCVCVCMYVILTKSGFTIVNFVYQVGWFTTVLDILNFSMRVVSDEINI